MRAGDLDPPDDQDDEPDDPRPRRGAPRFARLVRTPAARRLSPRRLVVGLAAVLAFGWGGLELGRRVVRALADYVAAQPEHQVRFDAIELVPPPPAYIARGAAGILESVRLEGRYGATIPLLATDKEALRVDLSRNHWLEEVKAVRTSYRHLAAEVVYRKPLALIELGAENDGTVIDRNGVELPTSLGQFAWADLFPRYRPAGESRPLVTIRGLGLGVPNRVGMVWKSADPTIGEGRLLEAARLAEEVVAHAGSRTPKNRPMPEFVRIQFERAGADEWFTLREPGGKNEVRWGSAPGREADDEPTAALKWKLLADFIDAGASPRLDLAPREYLKFLFDRVVVVRPPAPAPTTPPAARPRTAPRPKSR